MNPKIATVAAILILFLGSGDCSLAQSSSATPEATAAPEAGAQPDSSGVSPDKKWEYQPDESVPKIVKAGTDEVALDLSDQPAGNGFSFATVIWAPDSKRFAFNYGQGRTHATSLYNCAAISGRS